ncbi:MAG: aldehyde dehydrogenase family protein [Solirubrobacteraceae bacterium]
MPDAQLSTIDDELASVIDHTRKFYIDGQWVDPHSSDTLDVINPATEKPIASIALGDADDVDSAVDAAVRAFRTFSTTTREERIALLENVIKVYKAHIQEVAAVVSLEMGAPMSLAKGAQAPAGLGHLMATLAALKQTEFEEKIGSTTVVYEPVGVCGFITPWNWPLNQIAAKVAPALATGCTMVLKPSEIAPLNAIAFAQVLDEAGIPAGVFNLVHGDGPTVGQALALHPKIDMISFTGSTRAGIEVAKNAAPTVKRVTQELGGKSANIFLDDVDLESALARDVAGLYVNSGQSCNAGARMLIPQDRMEDAIRIAKETTEKVVVGDPADQGTAVGPVVSEAQYNKVQGLIERALEEGATLIAGGPGRPEGVESGYFVRPTVFANVTNDMTIAREEIFGPVLTLIGYRDEDEAVEIANDTNYGLAGMVSSTDPQRARAVARRMRTGMVHLNGAPLTVDAPFGGYRQSGNGREFAAHGLREFLEAKSIYGDNA